MAKTPFDEVPLRLFVMRSVVPLGMLGVCLFFLVGVLDESAILQGLEGPEAILPFWEAAPRVYHDFMTHINSLPSFCVYGDIESEFHKNQCDRYWGDLIKSGLLGSIPLVGLGLVFAILVDQLKGFYRKLKKTITAKGPQLKGTVTDPPVGPRDAFSSFYCLVPVMIQLADGKQVKVYVSSRVVPPLPGETLAAFDLGYYFGRKRFVALVHSPHIAVLK